MQVVRHNTKSEYCHKRCTGHPFFRPTVDTRCPQPELFEFAYPVFRHTLLVVKIEKIRQQAPQIPFFSINRKFLRTSVTNMNICIRAKLVSTSHILNKYKVYRGVDTRCLQYSLWIKKTAP